MLLTPLKIKVEETEKVTLRLINFAEGEGGRAGNM